MVKDGHDNHESGPGRLIHEMLAGHRPEGEGVLPGGEYLLPQDTGSDGFYIAREAGS